MQPQLRTRQAESTQIGAGPNIGLLIVHGYVSFDENNLRNFTCAAPEIRTELVAADYILMYTFQIFIRLKKYT